ncbi:5-aminolevulinate synthase [Hortaea werneckii]|nr:5-aminolevulinate synthase [Hortaea werneckii]
MFLTAIIQRSVIRRCLDFPFHTSSYPIKIKKTLPIARSSCRLGGSSHRLADLHALPLENILQSTQSALAGLQVFLEVLETELLIGPQGLDGRGVLLADADEATLAGPVRGPLDAQLIPDAVERLAEVVAVLLDVARGRGDSETLLADRNGGVVDGLDVNLVLLEQEIGCGLGNLGVADEYGDDVRRVRDDGDVHLSESALYSTSVELLEAAVALVCLLVLNGSLGSSHGRWREGSGEDEAWGKGTDSIDHLRRAGNVAADASVCFAKSSSDDVDAILNSSSRVPSIGVGLVIQMFRDTGAAWPVHADCMNLVEESDGAVFIRKIADFFDRTNAAAHAVDALECNNLRYLWRKASKLCLKVLDVIVLEDHLLRTGVPNTLNHGCSLESRRWPRNKKRRPMPPPWRAASQSDVSSTSCTGTVRIERLVHPLQNLRVPAHPQVVVGTPHRYSLFWTVALVLMLLVQLVLVERIVIEFDGLGRLRSDTMLVLVLLSIGCGWLGPGHWRGEGSMIATDSGYIVGLSLVGSIGV